MKYEGGRSRKKFVSSTWYMCCVMSKNKLLNVNRSLSKAGATKGNRNEDIINEKAAMWICGNIAYDSCGRSDKYSFYATGSR